MTEIKFENRKQIKVIAKEDEVYYIGYLSDLNYQINEKNKNYFIKKLSALFDKYYDGTIKSIWNDIAREMYKENFEGFLWVKKDEIFKERQRLGEKIKDLRKEKGLTAKALAQTIRIDAGNLSRIEKGQLSVGIDILNRIAECFNMRLDFVPKEEKKEKDYSKKKIFYSPKQKYSFGKNDDNSNKLEKLCKQKAKTLVEIIDMTEQSEISIPFWTNDTPTELICVCKLFVDKIGNVKYNLDFSQSTL